VPTYAVGVPLLIVPLRALGGDAAAFLLFPFVFGLTIIAGAWLAHRIGSAVAALVTAVWLATSPVALLHGMQAMSDVPVTLAWLFAWWCALASRRRPAADQRSSWHHAVAYALPVAIAGAVVAYLQWRYFGSPLRSGYGTASEIYAVANVAPNAALYLRWLADTHGPWLIAAPLALWLGRSDLAWLLVFAASVLAAYLVYAQFETWTYLRFLLPALAIAAVGVSALISRALESASAALRVPVVAVLLLALAATHVAAARDHGVFRFADRQARGRVVGAALAQSLPANAVIISGEHSGTMRYYTGRSILRWDLIAAEAMPTALARLSAEHELWVVLDDWEESAFRQKLPALAAVSIDYEPTVESAAGVGIRTRAWRMPSQ
jgi:hypothetical protein